MEIAGPCRWLLGQDARGGRTFADATGLGVNVCHFPPGTSKWNKIEHRLFSQITQNWRGRPLVSRETVVALIRGTTTTTGLRVRAKLDTRRYPTGKDVPEDALRRVQIKPDRFHGDWNYSVRPAENALAPCPLARHAPTRSAHFCLVVAFTHASLLPTMGSRKCRRAAVTVDAPCTNAGTR
jgi:hypothetical protein